MLPFPKYIHACVLSVLIGGFALYAGGVLRVDFRESGEGVTWEPDKLGTITERIADEIADQIQTDDYVKADAAYEKGNYGEALGLYIDATNNDPKNPKAGKTLFFIAKYHEESGERVKAIEAYQRFIVNYPRHTKFEEAKLGLERLGVRK